MPQESTNYNLDMTYNPLQKHKNTRSKIGQRRGVQIREVEVVQAFQPILWMCRSNTDPIPSVVSMSHGLLS